MIKNESAAAAELRELKADGVVSPLQGYMRESSRSSRCLLSRHAARFRSRYERAAQSPAGASAAESAARARVLRFLGRERESSLAFTDALRLDADCAEALAWRWDADFKAETRRRSYADIDRAILLEPKRALWSAFRGLGRAVDFLNDYAHGPKRPFADLDRALELDARCLPALIGAGLAAGGAKRQRVALDYFLRAQRVDPNQSFLYASSAYCRIGLKDYDGFVADCEKAVYLNEGLGYFQCVLGVKSADRSASARVEAATHFLSRHKRAGWIYVYRGDLLRAPEVNDHAAGLKDLELSVEFQPDCAYAWAYLSRARLSHGDQVKALEAADRSVALKPDCGWISIWHGEIRRRLGDVKGALADFDRGLALDPDYEFGYAWRGGAKRSLGLIEESLGDLETACAFAPNNAWALHERSLALRKLGRTAEALEDLETARRLDPKFSWCPRPEQAAAAVAELDAEIGLHPDNALAWAWRGASKFQAADHRGAKSDLDRAISLSPSLDVAWAWRGRAAQELGEKPSALKDLDEALRIGPGDAHACAWRGRVRHQLGDVRGALADLTRAVELDRTSSWIYLWRGEAAEELGLLDEAGKAFDLALDIDRRHVAALVARGRLRLRRGDEAGARADLDEARAMAPSDPAAAYWRGALNERTSRWSEARADYGIAAVSGRLRTVELAQARRFLERGPVRTAEAASRALLQARKFAAEGRHADAAAVCDDLLGIENDDVEALRVRAEAYRCAGDFKKMLADLDRRVEIEPDSADARVCRGVGRRNSWDFQGALSDADEAIRLTAGKSVPAHQLRCEALRNLGRYEEALASAERAIKLLPNDGWAYVVRGKMRRQSGDLDGALADFRRAAALSPADGKARGYEADVLRKLGRLKAAVAAARAAAELAPTIAWVWAVLGECERAVGRRKEGLRLMLRAVRLDDNGSCAHDFLGASPPQVAADPTYAWVYAWRGGIRRKHEDWEAARRDLERAVELDSSCFWARAWLGELKLVRGDVEGGLAELTHSLEDCGDYADAWIWRGRAEFEKGRWDRALKSYRRALALEPDGVWGLIGSALALERLGRGKEAADCMGRAQQSAPGLFQAAAGARG